MSAKVSSASAFGLLIGSVLLACCTLMLPGCGSTANPTGAGDDGVTSPVDRQPGDSATADAADGLLADWNGTTTRDDGFNDWSEVVPGNTGGGEVGGAAGGAACPPQAFWAETSGCTVTLRLPADCAAVSISDEFSWEGDACHTPYYLQVTGNPPDEDNYNDIYIDSVVNALAWAEPFALRFIEGLNSADGWYHWRVCNTYETGCSATRAFRVE